MRYAVYLAIGAFLTGVAEGMEGFQWWLVAPAGVLMGHGGFRLYCCLRADALTQQ